MRVVPLLVLIVIGGVISDEGELETLVGDQAEVFGELSKITFYCVVIFAQHIRFYFITILSIYYLIIF